MDELKRRAIRFCMFLLILEGIDAVWEFVDVVTYGESQRSAADAVAAIVMTNCLLKKTARYGYKDKKEGER